MSRTRHRTASSERGAATLETALVSGLFFMALLPIFDFGRTAYVASNLQHATRSTARLVTLGALAGGVTQTAVAALLSEQSGLDLSGATVAVTSNTLTGGHAGTGELVTIRASLDVPLVTPYLLPFFNDGIYEANASATFLSEIPAGA